MRPRLFGRLKCACKRGRRKSQSIIKTCAPVWANMKAVFIAVVVLPSDGWLEVTRIVLGGVPADESKSDVRKWRYDSAMGERTSLTRASAVASPGVAVSPPFNLDLSFRPAGISARAGR